MKSHKCIVFFSLLTAALPFVGRAADNQLTDSEKKHGWVLLFDGKTLDGWEGQSDLWKVRDGAIVGRVEKDPGYNTFLCTKDEFSNFVLRFQVMLVKDYGNSGLQYRSHLLDKTKYIVGGYQADIAPTWWGTLYEERGRGTLVGPLENGKAVIRKGEWNDYEISAIGSHLKQKLNNVVTVDWEDTDTSKRSAKGILALQLHTGLPGMEVQFKNIKLKKIEAAKQN